MNRKDATTARDLGPTLPPAESPGQDVWRLRRVIADTITATRINDDGPWVTADAIAKALQREGYDVAPKPRIWPHKGMTDEQVAEWRQRWDAATRAPQAPGGAHSPGGGTSAGRRRRRPLRGRHVRRGRPHGCRGRGRDRPDRERARPVRRGRAVVWAGLIAWGWT